MKQLENIIKKLETKHQVDAVFLTGSHGSDKKPYSDIDLVIILDENKEKINSLYTWIDNKFADIFFFDHADLNRIENADILSANGMDAIFLTWLNKASISFDKSGKLFALKTKINDLNKKVKILENEKRAFCHRINYNFIANKRYFESNDVIYHEALELRLLYSVSEIISGYFEFRDIPWRGEKNAIKYFKENDENFYKAFVNYTKAANVGGKFKFYTEMFFAVFAGGYEKWLIGDILTQSKNQEYGDNASLKDYWTSMAS